MKADNEIIIEFSKLIDSLQEVGREILGLEPKFLEIELDMSLDLNHMSKLFAIRLFQQLNAMFLLQDNENHILIARSMFEGGVYLVSCINDEQLASDWRNYSFIIDKQRFDSMDNKDDVPESIIKALDNNKNIINGFKTKNGKFHNSWKKDKTIRELSSIAKLEYFYNTYYSPMSDFHHWGTKSFGIRYECLKFNVKPLNTAEIKSESLNAWCISISSILNVLSILSNNAKNKELVGKINELQNKTKSIYGLKTHNITS